MDAPGAASSPAERSAGPLRVVAPGLGLGRHAHGQRHQGEARPRQQGT